MLQNSDLTFSPANNRLGRADSTFKSLMGAIEDEIDVSDYVHQEYPIYKSAADIFDNMEAALSRAWKSPLPTSLLFFNFSYRVSPPL